MGNLQAVILAAGKGKRLYPLTHTRSKAMQPILGMPLVGRVLESLYTHGIRDFIVILNPNDGQAISYLKEELPLQVNLRFAYQPQPLGAAHALRQAAPFIRGDFILSACDNLIPSQEMAKFIDHWERKQPMNGLLALMEVPDEQVSQTGIVELNGSGIQRIVEKPSIEEAPSRTASLPLYIFSPKILQHLEHLSPSLRGEYELQETIQRLIEADGRVEGFRVTRRLTLTTPGDLLEINRHFLRRERVPHQIVQANSVGGNTDFIPPVFVEAGVIIGSNCSIGPEVYLEKGCRLGDAVTLRKSILLEGAELPDGVSIIGEVVFPLTF